MSPHPQGRESPAREEPMRETSGQEPELWVGIDVSKVRLDVAVRPSGDAWQCANDEAGIAALLIRLQELAAQLIVLEATGGLERAVGAALALAGLPVAVVNPRQVRDFAKATGQLAKTDALDAAVLAHFAQAIHPAPRPLLDAHSQALVALVERRRQVVGMLTAEKNRCQQALPPVRPKVIAHIRWLERALDEWDGELDQTLHASPVWRERDQLLRSVPGVGPAVSRTLLAHLPELGKGSVKHIATLVGLAPLNRDSGRDPCHLGRATARACCALHGGTGGRPLQPSAACLL
jgi:transposase